MDKPDDKRKKAEVPADHSLYAEGKSMQALLIYLCSLARPSSRVEPNVEICRNCESACAFGRQYVKRWDAGERPQKRRREPKQQKGETKVSTNKKQCDEVTLQEQLETKIVENTELRETVQSLAARNQKMTLELEAVREALEESERQRNSTLDSMRRLKAWVLDQLHPELKNI